MTPETVRSPRRAGSRKALPVLLGLSVGVMFLLWPAGVAAQVTVPTTDPPPPATTDPPPPPSTAPPTTSAPPATTAAPTSTAPPTTKKPGPTTSAPTTTTPEQLPTLPPIPQSGGQAPSSATTAPGGGLATGDAEISNFFPALSIGGFVTALLIVAAQFLLSRRAGRAP